MGAGRVLKAREKRAVLKASFGDLGRARKDPDVGGFALVVAAADGSEGNWAERVTRLDLVGRGADGGGKGFAAQVRRMASPTKRRRVVRLAGAVGSPQRLAIVAKLLEGPATYRALQKATGLKVGPLYHHINQLRLASLVAPKERDLYRLTRAGRNLLVVLLAALPLLTDTRPVPEC